MNDGDINIFNENTQGKTKVISSGLFMSSLRLFHQQEAQHFDERFIRKQCESFLSKPEPFGFLGTEI